MSIFLKLKRHSRPNCMNSACKDILVAVSGLLSSLVFPALALAQSVSLPLTADVNGFAEHAPACASSANGTGHIICVFVGSNLELAAASVLVDHGAFAVPALDSTSTNDVNQTSTGTNNLPIGISVSSNSVNTGIGNSSCASTADATGDVVCAINSNGSLVGVRFNIFANPQSEVLYPVQNLGITVPLGANASCTIGAPRFSVGPAIGASVVGEDAQGDTICAVTNTSGEAIAVAFNPATGQKVTQDLGVAASGASCVYAPDGTAANPQIVCALLDASGIQGIAFDPRTQVKTAPQTISSSGSGTLGCGAPNDTTGDLICVFRIIPTSNVTAPPGGLEGFAFNPRSKALTTVKGIGAGTGVLFRGTPTCSGVQGAAGTEVNNQVMCAINSNLNIVNTIIFDPRSTATLTAVSSGITASSGPTNGRSPPNSSDLSCTFQNVNPGQVSCVGILPSQNDLFSLILGAPIQGATPTQGQTPLSPTLKSNVPAGFQNEPTVGGAFSVSWTAATGATSYKVWAAVGLPDNGLGNSPLLLVDTDPAGTLTQTLSEPAAGVYSFQVQACNASGCDAGSNIVSITVQ
jgi:hypothetical protein